MKTILLALALATCVAGEERVKMTKGERKREARFAKADAARTADERAAARVSEVLESDGGGMTRAELLRATGLKSEELGRVLERLKNAGAVVYAWDRNALVGMFYLASNAPDAAEE